MIARVPAAIAARNGASSTSSSSSTRRSDDGKPEVRVDRRRAVAREVLRAGGDSALLEPGHERADVARDERGIRAERAHADDRVQRVRVDVGDRREVVRDAGGAELRRPGRARPAP